MYSNCRQESDNWSEQLSEGIESVQDHNYIDEVHIILSLVQ